MRREPVPQSDDAVYRDYLVDIVSEFETQPAPTPDIIQIDPVPKPPPKTLRPKTLADLKERFKQDFSTADNAVIGANVVPIEVVSAVLTDDLKLPANQIPAQGNASDRQYLDQLIAASGQTVEALSTTYRLDLSRADTERTTRVRENILTLQQYLRDGQFNAGYNPFFLYKEEWRLRFRTPFFAENHYALKKGLFASSADRQRAQALIQAVVAHEDYKDYGILSTFVSRLKIFMRLDRHLTEGHRWFAAEEYALARDEYAGAEDDVQQLISQMRMKVNTVTFSASWTPSLNTPQDFRDSLDPAKQFTHHAHEDMYGDTLSPTTKKGNMPVDIPMKIPPAYPFRAALFNRLTWRYDNRAKLTVDSPATLEDLEDRNAVSVQLSQEFLGSATFDKLEAALFDLHDDLVSLMPHVACLLIPISRGDLAAARGDFPMAANHYARVAREQLLRGSLTSPAGGAASEPGGDLPWSWASLPSAAVLNGRDYPCLNEDCEEPFLLLQLGALYLAWADQLYRTDQEPEVYRARELYKAVLRQYGLDPLPGEGLEPLPLRMKPLGPAGVYGRPGVYERPGLGARLEAVAGAGGAAGAAGEPGPAFELAEVWRGPGRIGERWAEGAGAGLEARGAALEEALAETPPAAKAAWSPLIEAQVSPFELAEPEPDAAEPLLNGAMIVAMLFPVNPAILAQQMRARIGLTQIDAGLNFYGYSHNLVPLLRYRPLISAARYFATLAKKAQTDFITYKERAEDAEIALLEQRTAVATSAIRVQIESHRILEAQQQVRQAEIQIEQVQDAIAAKKAEITDGNSLCGQVKDFFGGIKDFFTGVPDRATSYIKSDYSAAFGLESAAAGTTAGLGVVGGMALFGVAASVTMSGMASRANKRVTELQKLQTQQLPTAMAAAQARKHELAIAQWQKAVASLEAATAQEVLRYSQLRTFNVEMWTQMARAMKSTLRRYLDLGAMAGWLAERALSYFQDRDVRLMRFDYFQPRSHGALGADALESDLAALEREYIVGVRQTAPIKWTVSLARDFPLAFGQLKATGECTIMTSADPLDRAYPGSFGHRVRAVEVAAIVPVTEAPPHGLLTNPGVSGVEEAAPGEWHTVVREPDTLPLSDFRLRDDMAIYQLPGETLMPFEGSGVDTLWKLEFPAAANPAGLATLADISLSFHLEARFSSQRRAALSQAAPEILTRSALFSAKQLFPQSLKTFVEGGDQDALTFAVGDDLLPAGEGSRKVTNVAVFFIGKDLPEITGELTSEDVPTGASFTTAGALAHSNHVPQGAGLAAPAADLDPLATGNVAQTWTLSVAAGDNPTLGDRKTISDVILGIEYTTELDSGQG
jgi:hypothetical protein